EFAEAHQRLQQMEDKLPAHPRCQKVREELRAKAEATLDEARKLAGQANPDRNAITAKLRSVESIYPGLPGLQDYYLKLNNQYKSLIIGVPVLPTNFLPGLDQSEIDRQVQDLLYESLVKLTSSRQFGDRYEIDLAAEAPKQLPLGRQFRIERNAF